MKKALYWNPSSNMDVDCILCPQNCHIRPGNVGTCRVRKNEEGTLYSLNYGRYSSLALDPIEKKPLYHFHPGSYLISVGTVGCNLRCGFCQNWTISQEVDFPTRDTEPGDVVRIAQRARGEDARTVGIAYTYNEPFMWYEFIYETSQLAHKNALVNVLVTNGFIQEEPLREILPHIDALNVDVKGFAGEYYKRVCHGDLDPVLRTVEMSHKMGRHVEVTTLIVPDMNDSAEEIEALSKWLGGIDRDIPIHFSRYYPNYKFDAPATPVRTLSMAREIARKHLDYVYLGNVWGREGSDTICPKCGETVIERGALQVNAINLEDHSCPSCGQEIKIRGDVFGPEGE